MPRNSDWRIADVAPRLDIGAVHIWRIDARRTAKTSARLARHLDAEERSRAARFAFEADRERFIVAHGALREILAGYLMCLPEELRFHASPQGKPKIVGVEDGMGNSALSFNLAHSGDLALVAVTRLGDVGVDIERMRPGVEVEAIAERFFAPEEREALRARPEAQRLGYFYRLWTCKEAYIKARGVGLTASLDRFSVSLGSDKHASILALDEGAGAMSQWSLAEIAPGAGYTGALAVEGEIGALTLWDWSGAEP